MMYSSFNLVPVTNDFVDDLRERLVRPIAIYVRKTYIDVWKDRFVVKWISYHVETKDVT